MADLAAGIAGEEHRIDGFLASGLLDMGMIVKADADDLVGVGYDRQMFDRIEGEIRRLVKQGPARAGSPAARKARSDCSGRRRARSTIPLSVTRP